MAIVGTGPVPTPAGQSTIANSITATTQLIAAATNTKGVIIRHFTMCGYPNVVDTDVEWSLVGGTKYICTFQNLGTVAKGGRVSNGGKTRDVYVPPGVAVSLNIDGYASTLFYEMAYDLLA